MVGLAPLDPPYKRVRSRHRIECHWLCRCPLRNVTPIEPSAESPPNRWLRLVPDSAAPVLVAVVGLLWLSEGFHWFAFNEHKGYTVLLAVSIVGEALLRTLLRFAIATVFRRSFGFSIRTLLLWGLAVALPCSWLATEMRQAESQRKAIGLIERHGGSVIYSDRLAGVTGKPASTVSA